MRGENAAIWAEEADWLQDQKKSVTAYARKRLMVLKKIKEREKNRKKERKTAAHIFHKIAQPPKVNILAKAFWPLKHSPNR